MKVYFIRHAQGYHNIRLPKNKNLEIKYPKITKDGFKQINELKNKIEKENYNIEKIFVSPLTRTLQTATGVFDKNKYKFISYEPIREVLHNPCNFRKKTSELINEFPHVDFSLVQEDDTYIYKETDYITYKRCDKFYNWLLKRNEKSIAIVSHGGFLFRFIKKYGKKLGIKNKNWFTNCKLRIGTIMKN